MVTVLTSLNAMSAMVSVAMMAAKKRSEMSEVVLMNGIVEITDLADTVKTSLSMAGVYLSFAGVSLSLVSLADCLVLKLSIFIRS